MTVILNDGDVPPIVTINIPGGRGVDDAARAEAGLHAQK